MHFFCNAIKRFVSHSLRIGTVSPHEYLCKIITKLNIHLPGHVAIRIEPRENFLEAFGWDYRFSGHFSVDYSVRKGMNSSCARGSIWLRGGQLAPAPRKDYQTGGDQ